MTPKPYGEASYALLYPLLSHNTPLNQMVNVSHRSISKYRKQELTAVFEQNQTSKGQIILKQRSLGRNHWTKFLPTLKIWIWHYNTSWNISQLCIPILREKKSLLTTIYSWSHIKHTKNLFLCFSLIFLISTNEENQSDSKLAVFFLFGDWVWP